MRVLVFGNFDWLDLAPVHRRLEALLREHPGLVVIEGGGSGPDQEPEDGGRGPTRPGPCLLPRGTRPRDGDMLRRLEKANVPVERV